MTFTGSSLSEMQTAVRKAIGLHWRIFLLHGVALIVLGVLAVIAPARGHHRHRDFHRLAVLDRRDRRARGDVLRR